MARLSSAEAAWSRPVIHDIFTAGGLVKTSIRTDSRNSIERRRLENEAKIICDEIKNREFNFPAVDKAIARIANYATFYPLRDGGGGKSLTAKQIADILAYACATQEVFWDDVHTARSTVEMETYRMGYLGRACWEFKCFLSQQAEKKPATRTPRPVGAGGTAGTARGASSYKSSGPKSGTIGGLIGAPGEKSYLPGPTAYDIVCTCPTKKKQQFVFIDPISNKADPNKVRFGDPSGQTACKLVYATQAEAEAAIERIYASGLRIPADITGFTAAYMKLDRNGYFKVRTEIGDAYIKAVILNEQVEEDLEADVTTRKSKFPEIADIDVYSEAMHRYE